VGGGGGKHMSHISYDSCYNVKKEAGDIISQKEVKA